MTRSAKIFLIIISVMLVILILLAAYYFFVFKKSKNDLTDPLACNKNDDCTYYSLLNCYNAKPINKDYKTQVLQIIESKDSLCGEIKTACISGSCQIVK